MTTYRQPAAAHEPGPRRQTAHAVEAGGGPLPFWTPLTADPHGKSRRLDRGWWTGYYGLALLAAQMTLAAWQNAQTTREPFAHLLHQERGQEPPRDLTPRLEEDRRRVRLWTQPLTEGE